MTNLYDFSIKQLFLNLLKRIILLPFKLISFKGIVWIIACIFLVKGFIDSPIWAVISALMSGIKTGASVIERLFQK